MKLKNNSGFIQCASCSVEILAGCRENHKVMGQNFHIAIPFFSGIGVAAKRGAETAFQS